MLLIVFVGPIFAFAGSRKDVYVDGSKTGTEDGSVSNPYHTISEALVHSDKRTDVHVAKGTYKDNIEIPKGVRIFGSDVDDVIIQAKNKKKVVVSMKDDTEINKVTIEKGRQGIWVKEDAEVSIIKCTVKNNDKDGISIAKGSTKKKDAVSITDSIIKNNGRAGIFSQKRRLVLIDNEIVDNETDGLDLAFGSSAWIEDNNFKDNDGSGMKLTLDSSNIWIKSNSFRNNGNEGIEISAWGTAGRIDINKSKFNSNENYAIARINKAPISKSFWNGLTIQSNNVFEKSVKGSVSPVILVR